MLRFVLLFAKTSQSLFAIQYLFDLQLPKCDVRTHAKKRLFLVLSLSNSYIFIMPFENVSGMIFGKFPPNLDVPAIPLLEVVKRF